METNGTTTEARAKSTSSRAVPTVGRIVRYVLRGQDEEHAALVRAAIVVAVHARRLNLAVFLDGQADYEHIEFGNAQISAANRESALVTALRRENVDFDPEGKREGSWHWPAVE
jgi:hypothetical protein